MFTDEQIMKILEVTCRNPEEYSFESSHWNLNQLMDAVVKEGIVESISAKTISRFLKYGKIRLYLVRYWLHSSKKTEHLITPYQPLKMAGIQYP